jgi:hypothetical protein
MSAERLRALKDEDLGAAIVASEPSWPSSPALGPAVTGRIAETERLPQLRPRLSLPSRRRTVVILVAATLLLAVAAGAAALVVHIGAESVTVVPGPPTSSVPAAVLGPDVLGDPSSIGAVASAAGFEPLVPAALGTPAEVWIGSTPPGAPDATGSRIVMAWDPTPALPAVHDLPWGAVLIEFHGNAEVAAKTVFEDTGGEIRGVNVDGRAGLWVTGEHTITLAHIRGGKPVTLRVTGNVLLWQRGDVTLRLETTLGLPAALEVARSIP